jgi:hypothetical protein
MNPTICYASFKKIYLFLHSLVEGHVLFCLFFTVSFLFWSYYFQISLAVSGDTVL